MSTLVHAELTTRHFTFEAYAPTKREATALMKAGTQKHCLQCNAPHAEFWREYRDAIEYTVIRAGIFMRDRHEMDLP